MPRWRLPARAGAGRCRWREFITGNRKTVLAPDELVTASPRAQAAARRPRDVPQARRARLPGDLHRLGGRSSSISARRTHSARRPSPSAPARPCRGGWPQLESRSRGRVRRRSRSGVVTAAHVRAALAPIDDVRGSADYRRDARRDPGAARAGAVPGDQHRGRRMNERANMRARCRWRSPSTARRSASSVRTGRATERGGAARAGADRHQGRLQRRRLRRLHGADRWRAGVRVHGVCRAGAGPNHRLRRGSCRRCRWAARCSRPSTRTTRRSAASVRPAC